MFGQIAAANSLSDVYAMGGRPITVMNILCFPINDRDPIELHEILRGGAEKVVESGAVLLGGHSVDDTEPKFGLSVTGLIHPNHVTTNAGARPGDVIVLTKPLGTGIITTAAKYDACSAEILEIACQSMATLNAAASDAMRAVGIGAALPVHAATDITGFALVGHLFHLAKASNVAIELFATEIPLFPEVERLALAGNITRGDKENREYLANRLEIDSQVPAGVVHAILDPQTSGGLAICVQEDALDNLLEALKARGVATHAVVGRVVEADSPMITLR